MQIIPPDASGPHEAARASAPLDPPSAEAFRRLARLARRVAGARGAALALDGELYADGDAAGLDELCRRVAAAGVALSGETGATLGVPLNDPDGQALGALCVSGEASRAWSEEDREALEALASAAAADVALRRAEAALARERDFGVQVMSALGQGIVVLELGGRVEYANPSVLRMLAAEPAWLAGHPLWAIAPPEDSGAIEGIHARALAGERSGGEVRLHRQDGEVLYAYVAGAPRLGPEGEVVGTLLTVSNMTGRRQAEKARSEADDRFRRLSEASEEGIVIHEDGRVLDANRASAHIFGFADAGELLGRPIFDAIAPESRAIAERHLASGTADPLDLTGLRRDGTRFPVQLRERPIVHGGRTVRVVTVRDLSEQHVVERLKDEFVSVVSHELRTPLTSLRGSLGLLASGRLNHHQARRMLEVAVQNTDRLVRLINDILDVERIGSGQVAMEMRPTSADALVEHAVAAVRGLAEKSRTRIIADTARLQVRADADRIVQVLVNLLSNAIKFSPDGSRVRLTVETSGGDAVFRLADEGRGIPADKLESIFERFGQVDASDSRKLGGTGLGLTICRSILQQHGGRIWAESVQGEGSTFTFTLPLAEHPIDADGTKDAELQR
ncbi:MAG TPA: ATP-binding protein [Longimicrobium sp.]